MIYTHNRTKQRLLFKTSNSLVSTLYVLDEQDNKVPDTNERGHSLLDVEGEPRYKMAICLSKNLTVCKTQWVCGGIRIVIDRYEETHRKWNK